MRKGSEIEIDLFLKPPLINNESIVFNTQNSFQVVTFENICFCKAEGSYTIVTLVSDKELLVSKSLITIERILSKSSFIRCHNSYLVNGFKVEKFDKKTKELIVYGKRIPVSRRKCCQTLKKLKSLNDHL